MNSTIQGHHIELHLQPHDLIHMGTSGHNVAIECQQGVLWVTCSGDIHDHMLTPGDRYIPEERGKVIIEAMLEAQVRLIDDHGKPRITRLVNNN